MSSVKPDEMTDEANGRASAETLGGKCDDMAGARMPPVRQNVKLDVHPVISTGWDAGVVITEDTGGFGVKCLLPSDGGLQPDGSGGSGGKTDQTRGPRARPRGGDQFGIKKKKRKYCESWGKIDKSGKESKRRRKKRARENKSKKDMDDFERRAMLELHPQACPICLEEPKTMLLVDCEDQVNGHRQHGVCDDCVRDVLAMQAPRCPECNLRVHRAIFMGTAFFV